MNRGKMEKITVIIPNYNGIKYLEDCFRTLDAQEGAPEYRVLVVDNGSGDGSAEYIRSYVQAHEVAGAVPYTLVELPENTGFCHAVNVGIQASEAPYVVLLNNDTKVEPGFLKALYEAMEARPEAFSVSAAMLMWDNPELLDDAGDNYCVLGWAYSRGKGRPATEYEKVCRVFSSCGGAAIYRREVFDEIGYFDELHFAYLEDLDMGYRARIHGYENWYEPRARVIHYGSASTGSRYNEWKTDKASANSVYIIGKNMPLLQWIWNLPFLLIGFLVKFVFFSRKRMGKIYRKGLAKGLKRCFSAEGRKHKVPFHWKYLGNYLRIQGLLYRNLLRFPVKK